MKKAAMQSDLLVFAIPWKWSSGTNQTVHISLKLAKAIWIADLKPTAD